MAKVLVTESYLEDIGDAIRAKLETQDTYKPSQMANAIGQISGGATLITKNITQNGTYDASDDEADGYSSVNVNVPSGGNLVAKTITENGTYDPADDNADGYSSVIVNVSGGSSYLEEWDFTESLVGKNHGLTPTISGAVQDSNGVTFDSMSDYLKFGGYASWNDITIEVDVANMNLTRDYHRRFLMRDNDEGFIYRNTGKWAFYAGSWVESNETDGTFFANSTVKIHVDSEGYWHIYKDGVLWWEPSLKLSLTTQFFIGSDDGNTINNVVITGMRIY